MTKQGSELRAAGVLSASMLLVLALTQIPRHEVLGVLALAGALVLGWARRRGHHAHAAKSTVVVPPDTTFSRGAGSQEQRPPQWMPSPPPLSLRPVLIAAPIHPLDTGGTYRRASLSQPRPPTTRARPPVSLTTRERGTLTRATQTPGASQKSAAKRTEGEDVY